MISGILSGIISYHKEWIIGGTIGFTVVGVFMCIMLNKIGLNLSRKKIVYIILGFTVAGVIGFTINKGVNATQLQEIGLWAFGLTTAWIIIGVIMCTILKKVALNDFNKELMYIILGFGITGLIIGSMSPVIGDLTKFKIFPDEDYGGMNYNIKWTLVRVIWWTIVFTASGTINLYILLKNYNKIINSRKINSSINSLIYDNVKILAELREKGILTEEEFQKKKKELLEL